MPNSLKLKNFIKFRNFTGIVGYTLTQRLVIDMQINIEST